MNSIEKRLHAAYSAGLARGARALHVKAHNKGIHRMRKSLLALLFAAGGLALTSLAQAEVQLKDGHPDRYTVVKGDTLWDISGKLLRQPWKWPEIWHANPQVANPHLIYPVSYTHLTLPTKA